MKVFIDSNIASMFIRGDLSGDNLSHLETILLSWQKGKFELYISQSTREKLRKLPEVTTTINKDVLRLLRSISPVEEKTYCIKETKVPHIGNTFNPAYEKLIKLVDNIEARQIFQAITHEHDIFLTLNEKVIFNYKEIMGLGVKALNLKDLSTQLLSNNCF